MANANGALTTQEQRRLIISAIHSGEADFGEDANGQLIVRTGLYKWQDQSVHNEEDPARLNADDRNGV
jgi:hypothetical protein